MRPLLAISGKRFAGKDTLAEILAQLARSRGRELATYAFAGESKRLFVAAERLRGVDIDQQRLSSDRAYKERWRPRLTEFTVASIAADPLIFVRAVAQRIEADPRPALITDLRLRLELDWLRPRFALTVVRLLRPDAQRSGSGWSFDAARDLHATETELDDPALWNQTVVNDGTLAQLEERATGLLNLLW